MVIMNKYYYFAMERFEEVASEGTARTKRVPVMYLSKTVFSTPEDAYDMGKAYVVSHVNSNLRFKIVGFDEPARLDERGRFLGLEEPKTTVVFLRNPLEMFSKKFIKSADFGELCDMLIGTRKYDTADEAAANLGGYLEAILCASYEVQEAIDRLTAELKDLVK